MPRQRGMPRTRCARIPYRERGWQILMQIAAAVGDHDAVIGAYRECRASLAGVGIEPSPATQALVDSLRSGARA